MHVWSTVCSILLKGEKRDFPAWIFKSPFILCFSFLYLPLDSDLPLSVLNFQPLPHAFHKSESIKERKKCFTDIFFMPYVGRWYPFWLILDGFGFEN